MYNNLDMGIMSSVTCGKNIVTIDTGLDDAGRVIYQVSWFNGRKWKYVRYRRFNEARATYRMILEMITI